jgi:hypothetical protein
MPLIVMARLERAVGGYVMNKAMVRSSPALPVSRRRLDPVA